MDKFRIIGGKKLKGGVVISGAKNSALPCLAAALLTSETLTLRNVPYVRDLITMRRLLEDLGCTVLVPELRTHQINAGTVEDYEAPYELVKPCGRRCWRWGRSLAGSARRASACPEAAPSASARSICT